MERKWEKWWEKVVRGEEGGEGGMLWCFWLNLWWTKSSSESGGPVAGDGQPGWTEQRAGTWVYLR